MVLNVNSEVYIEETFIIYFWKERQKTKKQPSMISKFILLLSSKSMVLSYNKIILVIVYLGMINESIFSRKFSNIVPAHPLWFLNIRINVMPSLSLSTHQLLAEYSATIKIAAFHNDKKSKHNHYSWQDARYNFYIMTLGELIKIR